MGGLVVWRWQQNHFMAPDAPRVAHLVLIGAPLLGSCEIFRTLAEGYSEPKVAESWTGQAGEAIKDTVLKVFLEDVAPAAFSFPGAFQLLPAVPSEGSASCVPVPEKEEGPVPFSPGDYFSLSFWGLGNGGVPGGPGQKIIQDAISRFRDGLGVSESEFTKMFSGVLATAKAFRGDFERKLRPSKIPVTAYSSEYFKTPYQAWVEPRSGEISWPFLMHGDGRVIWQSAGAARDTRRHVEAFAGLRSVHGDLPNSDRFEREFIDKRLSEIVQAHRILGALRVLSRDAAFLTAYRQAFQRKTVGLLDWARMETALLGQSLPPSTERDADMSAQQQVVEGFNRQVDSQPDPVLALNDLRGKHGLADRGPGARDFGQIRELAASLEMNAARHVERPTLGDVSLLKAVSALGRQGSALVVANRPKAAVGPLTEADLLAQNIPTRYDFVAKVRQLKASIVANLGMAFFAAGDCQKAEEYLRRADAQANPYARSYLRRPCTDARTGRTIQLSPAPGPR
jgi:hypothetical protein